MKDPFYSPKQDRHPRMSAPKIPEGPWTYEAETERVFGPRRELICWMKPSPSEPDKAALNGAFIASAPDRIAALETQVQQSYSEDAIITAFWTVWDGYAYGSGAGNSVIYGLLDKLKSQRAALAAPEKK